MTLDMKKLNPWNWFKREEENESRRLPVTRREEPSPNIAYLPSHWLSLRQDIDRMFDNFLRNFERPLGELTNQLPSLENTFFRPNIDIESTDKEYHITLEIPGVNENDIKLEFEPTDNILTIRGEKNKEREETDGDYYWSERSYGSFERIISLPNDADPDQIKAVFKNGVLNLIIDRKEPSKKQKVRQITVDHQ
jgi:HSP20 family protein